MRVFRLSRIQGKVGYASKAEHDFSPPEDFDRRDYGSRADWQLGEIKGTAKIFVRERIAWLIERDFGGYGELRPAKKSDGAPGKGSVFETDYASDRELIAWVLRWRQNAQVLAPDDLREEAESRLGAAPRPPPQRLRAGRDRRPAAARRAPPRPLQRPRRGGDPARALRPPGHPRRDADRSGEAGRAAAGRRAAPAARADRRGAARGHRAAQRRQLRRRHLRPLRRNHRRRDRGRLRALRRQLRPPGAAAAAGGEGAGRGDRPLRRPPAADRPAEARARRSSTRSATTPPRRGWRSPRPAAATPRWRGWSTTRSPAARCSSSSYYKENEDQFTDRSGRALPARERARGLVRRVLRPDQRGRPPLQARPDQGGEPLRARASSRGPRSRSSPGSRAG